MGIVVFSKCRTLLQKDVTCFLSFLKTELSLPQFKSKNRKFRLESRGSAFFTFFATQF